jgi:hypothetical protein
MQVKKKFSRNQVQSEEEVLTSNKKRPDEELLVVTEADFSDHEGHKSNGLNNNIKAIRETQDTSTYGTMNGMGSNIGAPGQAGSPTLQQ